MTIFRNKNLPSKETITLRSLATLMQFAVKNQHTYPSEVFTFPFFSFLSKYKLFRQATSADPVQKLLPEIPIFAHTRSAIRISCGFNGSNTLEVSGTESVALSARNSTIFQPV